MRWAVGVCALTCGCSLVTPFDELQCRSGKCADGSVADGPSDSAVEADSSLPRCDRTKPFSAPVEVPELHDLSAHEISARLTQDELGVFFTRISTDAGFRIMFASRTDITTSFGSAAIVNSVVGPDIDAYPSISGDELGLYFHSDRDAGNFDLFQASRPTRSAMFGTPAVIGTLVTPMYDAQPYIAPDGSFLLFVRGASSAGPLDIYQSAWTGAQFAAPVPLGVNTAASELSPVISSDGLTLYFGSDRGGMGLDVWRATRTDKMSTTFSNPVKITEVSGPGAVPTWISADDCVLYLHRDTGMGNLILATRPH